METAKKKKMPVNFNKAPFKGIISEVAKEVGVSPQAVQQAVKKYHNPRIIGLVETKVKERKDAIRRLDRAIAG